MARTPVTLSTRAGFWDLVAGQTVSAFGDWMATIALMVLVLRLTGSSTAVAGILALRLAPAMIGGSAAARAMRRWDRRHTMMIADAARAGVVVLIPWVHALWWIYLWAFLVEVLSLVFLPARDALVPDLIGAPDLPAANGIVLASSFGTIPLGAGAFAAIAALAPSPGVGFDAVFVVDAVTYLVSLLCVRRIRVARPAGETPSGETTDAPTSLRAAWAIPLVRGVLPASMIIALGLGTLFSGGVLFVRDALQASDTAFGVLIVLFGVGAAAGLGLLRLLDAPDGMRVLRYATAAQGLMITSMSVSPTLLPAFAGAVGFGAATALALTAGMSVLQERLDGRARVLAFAAFHSALRGGLALSALAAGAAADIVGARLVLAGAGIVVLAGSSMVRSAQSLSRPTTSPGRPGPDPCGPPSRARTRRRRHRRSALRR